MKVTQINKTNFMANSVRLHQINPENFINTDVLKKIANEKEMDILITKLPAEKSQSLEDAYSVFITKKFPIVGQGFCKTAGIIKYCKNLLTVNKCISKKELSVKMFNAVSFAVEELEKKLGNIR